MDKEQKWDLIETYSRIDKSNDKIITEHPICIEESRTLGECIGRLANEFYNNRSKINTDNIMLDWFYQFKYNLKRKKDEDGNLKKLTCVLNYYDETVIGKDYEIDSWTEYEIVKAMEE